MNFYLQSDLYNYDVTNDICNTERILPDDWKFGYEPISSSHGANWTTHSGADHFLYGVKFESEYVKEVKCRRIGFMFDIICNL